MIVYVLKNEITLNYDKYTNVKRVFTNKGRLYIQASKDDSVVKNGELVGRTVSVKMTDTIWFDIQDE